MSAGKKIISTILKVLIGILSIGVIVYKLRDELSSSNLDEMGKCISSLSGITFLLLCLLLIPVNWGLESAKWMFITEQVEKISFNRAQRSVYSGVCLGNIAPGRATEFLAKIIFFSPSSRPSVTVLHFVNGMFQLSVTYLIGFIALGLHSFSFGEESHWIIVTSLCLAMTVMAVFLFALMKIDRLLQLVTKRFSKNITDLNRNFRFDRTLLFRLFSFSFIRYFVFSAQMFLLIYALSNSFNMQIVTGTALYFLLTTSIPMISFLEAAIRAAIALVVYRDCGVNTAALAAASVMVWILNIVIPSLAGYIFLVKENFDFKIKRKDAV